MAVAVAATSLTQLFFDRSVGLADNGDGGRLMCKLGLRAAQNTPFRSPQWDYVAANGSPECHVVPLYRAYTDWAYVIHPVSWLYRNTVGGGHFDLRVLGFLDSAILGLLVGGLFLAWPGSRRRKALVCAAVSLVVLDIGFLAYFNSPLSDPAGCSACWPCSSPASGWPARRGSASGTASRWRSPRRSPPSTSRNSSR